MASFELNTESYYTPRIGLITFNSCDGCTDAESAKVLHPITADLNALRTAIDNREPPDPTMPMTCISCAVRLAKNMLSMFSRVDAMPVVLLLTDGEQTVLGGDAAAVYEAERAKEEGVDIMALSLGAANQATMQQMASRPPETYAREAESPQQLLDEIEDLVQVLCTEVLYSCRISSDCRGPLSMAVHGRGFVQRMLIEQGQRQGDLPDLLSCRIKGIGNGPTEMIVGASWIDVRSAPCRPPPPPPPPSQRNTHSSQLSLPPAPDPCDAKCGAECNAHLRHGRYHGDRGASTRRQVQRRDHH